MAIGAEGTHQGINAQSPCLDEIRHMVQGRQQYAMITEIDTNFATRFKDTSFTIIAFEQFREDIKNVQTNSTSIQVKLRPFCCKNRTSLL